MKNVLGILAFAGVLVFGCGTLRIIPLPVDPASSQAFRPSDAAAYDSHPDILGVWQVFFSWGCGSYSTAEWILSADGTFYCPDIDGGGTWILTGRKFHLEYGYPPYATYTGLLNIEGNRMEGAMADNRGSTGCWHSERGELRDTPTGTPKVPANQTVGPGK
jgi:hypothetical protein